MWTSVRGLVRCSKPAMLGKELPHSQSGLRLPTRQCLHHGCCRPVRGSVKASIWKPTMRLTAMDREGSVLGQDSCRQSASWKTSLGTMVCLATSTVKLKIPKTTQTTLTSLWTPKAGRHRDSDKDMPRRGWCSCIKSHLEDAMLGVHDDHRCLATANGCGRR